VRFGEAEMPLADEAGGIAGGPEMVAHRLFLKRQAENRFRLLRRTRIQFVAKALLIAAGHQPGSRRTTHGARYVAIRAAHAVPRQRVDPWRRHVLASLATEIRIAEIVREDDNDIRPPRLRGRSKRRRGQGENEKGEVFGHIRKLLRTRDSPLSGRKHWLPAFSLIRRQRILGA